MTNPEILEVGRDDVRFRVGVTEYGSVSLTWEYACTGCADEVAGAKARGETYAGPCCFCGGVLWRSSPDEGTSFPIDKLPTLIATLQRIYDARK